MEPLILFVVFALASGARGERNRLITMLAVSFLVATTYYFQRFL